MAHREDKVEHLSLKVDHFQHILVGGGGGGWDQLTVARIRGCLGMRNNSENIMVGLALSCRRLAHENMLHESMTMRSLNYL